ncbi:MAG: CRISPR-associated ring nuclease Csm6 [Thermodesulfovibrionales bacterium]
MEHSKFREVLIFVAGATPQIITETIYALIHQNPPVYPDEIHIITTSHGKNLIKENLIEAGRFREFCKEFNLREDILNNNSLVVVKDSKGNLLDDIRERADNESLGDFIIDFIKNKTKDDRTRLHCSLAGGRKTMSFYIGSALQLFGRPWDKLYHVLVTPEFESNPDFYYKPKKDKILTLLNPPANPLHTKDAEIFLAELPFIRLREKIPLNEKGFKELVREGQKEIDISLAHPLLRINLNERTVYIGNIPIDMVPFQLMIYTAYIRQKTDNCKYPDKTYCLNCMDCFSPIVDFSSRPALENMAKDYRLIYKNQPLRAEELLNRWREGLEQNTIRQNISKINRTIKEHIEDETLQPYYLITSIKKYAGSRYGVRVEKEKIRIE